MEYITSMQAAELTGFTKRHINNMYENGELPGAYKKLQNNDSKLLC